MDTKTYDIDLNILDKNDDSTLRVFGNEKTISKHLRYSWACAGNTQGVFMLIPKHELNIDGRYQREKTSNAKVLDIARNWDWRLFGALSVIMRTDDTFWIYDGGHRARAAFYRGDITELPCMVFEAVTTADEAKAFVGANTMKSNVKSFHVFKAALVAREPTAIATQRLLTKNGYHLSNYKTDKFGIQAVHTLQKLVERDHALAENTFDACVKIAVDGEQISAAIMLGMFALQKHFQHRGIDFFSGEHMSRLVDVGLRGLEAAIGRARMVYGKGGENINALGILEALNFKKRNRLTWVEAK